jgi:hypothetical protein
LGLSQSGKLSIEYLANLFASLVPGQAYELMCHPGYFDPKQVTDRKLTSYHEWENELSLLRSQQLQDLYQKHGIKLGQYE